MNQRLSPYLVALLTLTSCGTLESVPSAQNPVAPAPLPAVSHQAAAQVTVSEPRLSAPAAAPAAMEGFGLQAVKPVGLINAAANDTARGSAASNAIDGNTATKWSSNRATLNPTLTVQLNNADALALSTLTLNTDAFPAGTSFDVLVSPDNTTYTTVLAAQTKTAAGSVTLTLPTTAPKAKFVRIRCNNRTAPFGRVPFGIVEMSATADFPPPPVTGGFVFATNFPSVPQYRPDVGRLRYETVGNPGNPETVALNNLQTEALAANPTITLPAHARVTRTSDGTVLGDFNVVMTVPPTGEVGVVVGTDAATGDVIELIWPGIANNQPGDAIVRVQLGNAPANLSGSGIDVQFDFKKVDASGVTQATWSGSSTNTLVPPPTAVAPAPGGTGPGPVGTFVFATNFPSVPQYRPAAGRLRYEVVGNPGNPETVALNNLQTEALAANPTITLPAHARVTRTSDGTVLGDFNVVMTVPPAGEPGVVLGTDPATRDVVELIWPNVALGRPGDAIIRVQLGNAPAGLSGSGIDVQFDFKKVDANGVTQATWSGSSTNTIVPAAR